MDQKQNVQIPPEYKPISAWGYVGWELLFSIPIAGFIVLLIFAFGGCKNINLIKFARSKFCMALLVFIIMIVLLLIFILVGITTFDLFGTQLKI